MIEKPKRPKQPNIQDRQPPRTLQELINRYDLDNTKVYDFLDELVELLNTERKSIDTSINDLNNNKVNKSGDTMTGELFFNNKNIYNAIRKTRTFNNEDYQVSVGVGGNMCARMEFIKVPNNVLSSVEARSDGIWNGTSNRKLSEVAYVNWSTSFNFKMTGGHALVMINASDCVMLWVGGNYPNQSINTIRLYGNGIQVSFNANTQIVTLKFNDNHYFTGTAIIGRG